MKRFKKTALFVSTMLFVALFSGCDLYTYVTPSAQVSYSNPSWAPPYVSGVRYYYLPDIEAYYDLTTQEFVYLDNGQWSYSQNLPDIYAGFDLNTCFTVAIDFNTYQPWMHQQYYVSHYPRYYYRDYYDHSNIPYVRGYNENSRSAILWNENQRNRARKWDNENLNSNRQFRYSKPDRQQQSNFPINNTIPRKPDSYNNTRQQPNKVFTPQEPKREDNNTTRQQPNVNNNTQQPYRNDNNTTRQQPNVNNNTQQPNRGNNNTTPAVTPGNITNRTDRNTNATTPARTNYYGRTIGQPVKVERQMRQPTPRTAPAATPAATPARNEGDSRNQNDNNRR